MNSVSSTQVGSICNNQGNVTINNHGTLKGRILANTLHNYDGGTLVADFSVRGKSLAISDYNSDTVAVQTYQSSYETCGLAFLPTDDLGDSNVFYWNSVYPSRALNPHLNPYTSRYFIGGNTISDVAPYFYIKNTIIENGSVFVLKPFSNFGMNPGESNALRLLYAENGQWDIKNIVLRLDSKSPLLEVAWSELSDQNNLIVATHFLTPQQAGLSPNATRATLAALDAGVFTFNSNPEEWVPNISGAMVMGSATGLRHSTGSIHSRINSMRGINSGDELVFTQGLWYEGGYSDADQDKRNGIDGFAAQSTHLSIGYDIEAGNTLVGVAYTNGSTNVHSNDSTQKLDSDDHLFTLYGRYDLATWFAQSMLTFGRGNMDSARYVEDQHLEADINSRLFSGLLQVGMSTMLNGDWQIVPMLSVEYSKQHFDDYQESGGSLALDVDSQDYELLNIGGGAEIKRSWHRDWGTVAPALSAMVYYDVIGDKMQEVSHFNGGQTGFVSKGADPAQTSWEFSPSITLSSGNEYPASVKLGYIYSGKENFSAHSFSGELRFEF